MKKISIVILTAIFVLFGSMTAYAQQEYEFEDEYYQEQLEASVANEIFDSLPDYTNEMLDQIGIDELSPAKLLKMQPEQVWELIWSALMQGVTTPIKMAASIIAVMIIYSIFDGLKLSNKSSLTPVYSTVSALCAGLLIIVPAMSCFNGCSEVMESCQIFLTAYIPAFVAILASCGQPIASSIYSVLLFGASESICIIGQQVVLPLVRMFFALSIVCVLIPTIDFSGIINGISKVATWILSLCTTLYAALLTIQGAVGTSADSMTLKTAKYFASSLVPVVGGAVGEAMSSIFSSMSLLKTTTGAAGIIICVVIFLPQIIEIICFKLAFSLCSSIGQILGADRISTLLKSASTVAGIMLALLICYAMLIIISTAIMIMLKTS